MFQLMSQSATLPTRASSAPAPSVFSHPLPPLSSSCSLSPPSPITPLSEPEPQCFVWDWDMEMDLGWTLGRLKENRLGYRFAKKDYLGHRKYMEDGSRGEYVWEHFGDVYADVLK